MISEIKDTDEKILERPGRAPRILRQTNRSFRLYIRNLQTEESSEYGGIRAATEDDLLHRSEQSTPGDQSPARQATEDIAIPDSHDQPPPTLEELDEQDIARFQRARRNVRFTEEPVASRRRVPQEWDLLGEQERELRKDRLRQLLPPPQLLDLDERDWAAVWIEQGRDDIFLRDPDLSPSPE